MRKKTSYIKQCMICFKDFKAYLYQKQRVKFCSLKCKYESQKFKPISKKTKLKMSLSQKGKKISQKHRDKISESKKGKKLSLEHIKNLSLSHKGKMIGSSNPAWKGGVYPLHSTIRHIKETKLWREEVFKRDNYTCQICKIRNHYGLGTSIILHADHIKPFAVILNENNIKSVEDSLNCFELWDINNGRTLCKNCHLKTDSYGSVRIKKSDKNIEGDFEAFYDYVTSKSIMLLDKMAEEYGKK